MLDIKIILLIVAAAIGLIIRVLLSQQSPSQAVHKKPCNLVSVPTVMKQEQIFAVIRDYASRANLAVAEVNSAEGRVILQQDDQILHRGFWLPLYVSTHASGITVVEIGMQPLTPMSVIPEHILRKTAKDLEVLMSSSHPTEMGK